jgi:class 3 adenylate cyclase
VADSADSQTSADEVARENLRLARRVARLELSLEQIENIRDANAQLLNRLMEDLDAERQRSHQLLLNVLPERIVARLDAGETHIADRHAHVAVLMSVLVGFTPSAAQLSAGELVSQLNDLFTRFDEACAVRGVEKIKTIGDAYMAVAGLDDDADGDRARSVTAAVNLAHDMFTALELSESRWQMRVGIHAGPVVAGVIGTRKFAYDVWGDTVNVASRLESTSEPGRIHVSKTVADALAGRFLIEPRGAIELKGMGATETFFVTDRR